MWPFLKSKHVEKISNIASEEKRKPMNFSALVSDMGNYEDLGKHDFALKFWLPEPAEKAVRELAEMDGASMSEALRQFFTIHCYGLYVFSVIKNERPNLFKDDGGMSALFSRQRVEKSGKTRVDTYWVPELGKNVAPVKIWVPQRVRHDLQILADHVDIKLSQYIREIVISRLLGHGTLPKRPEMLIAAPLSAAEDWCDGNDVPWTEVSIEQYCEAEASVRNSRTEWVDEANNERSKI